MSRLVIKPSSPFPFSPLTNDEADRQRDDFVRVVALHVLFPDADAGLRRRVLASARQELADLTRTTDLRCGYVRAEWAELPA